MRFYYSKTRGWHFRLRTHTSEEKKMFHIALRRPNCISSQLQAWMAWEWARRVEKKNEIEIEGVLCLCDQLSYLEFVFEWIDSNRLGIFVMLQILSRLFTFYLYTFDLNCVSSACQSECYKFLYNKTFLFFHFAILRKGFFNHFISQVEIQQAETTD